MGHIVLAGCNHIYSEGLKIILAQTEHTLSSADLTLESLKENVKGAQDIVLLNSDKGITDEIKAYLKAEDLIVGYIASKFSKAEIDSSIEDGVKGLLTFNMDTLGLNFAISTMMENRIFVDPYIDYFTVNHQESAADNISYAMQLRLTSREYEVLKLMAKGQKNNEISKELNIKENTVKNHVSSVLKKLNVHNRVEAVLTFQNHQKIS
ncbi:response regulator transcription factor [Brochothrix campestris]|uniref:response regulator transcription factor n=1 Tax=Brochothrix campestris TaxID=2757 RepID=UPI0038CFBC9B